MRIAQVRRLLFVCSVCLLTASACHSSSIPQFEPSVIEFPATYTSFTSRVDVKFTLDGKPITGFQLAVPDPEEQKTFIAASVSPLGMSPFVDFGPQKAGEYTGHLQVIYEGHEYPVVLKGTARETPFCGVDDECLLRTFDPAREKCVVNNQADGTSCGKFSCDGRSACRSGACVFEPDPDPIPLCVPTEPRETLHPVWTFSSHIRDGEFIFRGTTDREGNLYFLDCTRVSGFVQDCDAVSLSADGVTRWRAPSVCSFPQNFILATLPQILVINDTLIIGGSGYADQIQAWKTDDGRLLWWLKLSGIGALTRLNDEQIAVLSGPDALLSVIRLEDGAIVSQRSMGQGLAGALLSSGTGELFGRAGDSPDNVVPPPVAHIFGTSASGEASWPMSVNSPQFDRILAVSGAHLVTSNGVVLRVADGKGLFTVPSVRELFDAVLPDDEHLVSVTDSATSSCFNTRVQSTDLTRGSLNWRCRVGQPISPAIFSVLHATADGGVVFASGLGSGQSMIEVLGGDGALTYAAQLPSDTSPDLNYFGPSFSDYSVPAVVGKRWITSAKGRSVIAAFDIPGLVPATKGWVGRGGNPRRDGSPEQPAE